MVIFPAIDLYENKAVRLLHGDYGCMTVYSRDPLAVVRDFEASGASALHLVDLEGAKNGTTPHLSLLAEIVRSTSLFTEIGGGIRTLDTVERYIDAGVSRVILGTAAVENPSLLREAVTKYGGKIAVGADVKDGYVAVKGWVEKSRFTLEAFMDNMQASGVETVICTDVSKDGAMRGTNLTLYADLSRKYAVNVTASGGVSSLEDVRKLREMNLYGAIIGKAYYTGAIDLRQAIEVAK
ncbi:MAG: 1-(5-phosphoribosyl)-5-[(5-phosphoribosylamino)methylideneamino]imidazole-4-carboxamide isomerase [Clostridia bacterium]|nr:1-(5-phosphoribosyl)-5-[(5-phosphoribosylamino)methylideneamino]imidazole-4-carboxamide isomerase [Clostridia bacterium]